MQIYRTTYLHDIVNIFLYILISTLIGLWLCGSVTEGYVELITISLNSIISGFINFVFVLILKRFSRTQNYLEIFFGPIQLISFEMTFLLFNEYSLFGLFDSTPINFHNGKFVMSLTSLISILIIYGRSIWIKTKTSYGRNL